MKDKVQGGKLSEHLRQGHKKYRRGNNGKRETIKNAVSIDERPNEVDTKERFGDWEADTVMGKRGTGALVTLAERKSRHNLIALVPDKNATTVGDAIIICSSHTSSTFTPLHLIEEVNLLNTRGLLPNWK